MEISTMAAMAMPVKEVAAMPSGQMAGPFSTLVVRPEEARTYNLFGRGEARLLATGENTNGAWFMGSFREDPGFMTHYHYHPNTDEQFYVLDGTLSVYIDEKWLELGPGALGVIPRGKPHAQGNRSDKPVHFIGQGAPAGFERLFPAVDALMKRANPGTPEFITEFQKICTGSDIVSLGPAPQ